MTILYGPYFFGIQLSPDNLRCDACYKEIWAENAARRRWHVGIRELVDMYGDTMRNPVHLCPDCFNGPVNPVSGVYKWRTITS